MKKLIAFIILIIITTFQFTCSNKSKTTFLIGKWEFEKLESRTRSAEDTKDMNKNITGLVATFNENGTFHSIIPRDGFKDTIAIGNYELVNEGKYIVTHEPGESYSDTVEIIDLSAKILKVQRSDKDILTLKKIQ